MRRDVMPLASSKKKTGGAAPRSSLAGTYSWDEIARMGRPGAPPPQDGYTTTGGAAAGGGARGGSAARLSGGKRVRGGNDPAYGPKVPEYEVHKYEVPQYDVHKYHVPQYEPQVEYDLSQFDRYKGNDPGHDGKMYDVPLHDAHPPTAPSDESPSAPIWDPQIEDTDPNDSRHGAYWDPGGSRHDYVIHPGNDALYAEEEALRHQVALDPTFRGYGGKRRRVGGAGPLHTSWEDTFEREARARRGGAEPGFDQVRAGIRAAEAAKGPRIADQAKRAPGSAAYARYTAPALVKRETGLPTYQPWASKYGENPVYDQQWEQNARQQNMGRVYRNEQKNAADRAKLEAIEAEKRRDKTWDMWDPNRNGTNEGWKAFTDPNGFTRRFIAPIASNVAGAVANAALPIPGLSAVVSGGLNLANSQLGRGMGGGLEGGRRAGRPRGSPASASVLARNALTARIIRERFAHMPPKARLPLASAFIKANGLKW